VLWFAIPMAAISAGTSKLYHYAYPYLAPLALAGGWLTAAIASRLYKWIAAPLGAFARARAAVLPGFLQRSGVEIALTIAGFAALMVALATAVLDRLEIASGGISIRNSSVVRPLAGAAVTWLVGAPPQLLAGALVAALLAVAMPISAYHANVSQARQTHEVLHDVRACLSPIFAQQIAAGRKARGTWVEATSLSFVPFYYLRNFGQWQPGGADSTPAILKSLLSPNEPQFALLSPDRLKEITAELTTNRDAALERAAALAGTDAATLAARLDLDAIGLVRIDENVLLLPGAYAVCGHERIRFGAQ